MKAFAVAIFALWLSADAAMAQTTQEMTWALGEVGEELITATWFSARMDASTGGSLKQNVEGFIGYLVIAVIAGWLYFAGFNETWYAVEYHVSPGKIHIDTKPKDCDFMHAPLGDKGCHYEAAAAAYNAAGEVVGGDDAPKYSHDSKTGKPIISWDKGKSWVWFTGADIPDTKINSVVVTWSKVTDD
jgi:hypothetical protein